MDTDALIDRLDAAGPLLLTAAEQAGWDARVPACEWDVRTLVEHVGGVHRWATAIVAGHPEDAVAAAHGAVPSGPGVPDSSLASWFSEGHANLVAALRAAPADLAAFTFLRGAPPREFWARRQAHETAVHRADVAVAGGAAVSFDTDFAQDGIVEIAQGFGARRTFGVATPGVLGLRATDSGPDWRITFGGGRIVAEAGAGIDGADATVSGTSGELYLWLWNRPSHVSLEGDAEVAALWGRNVRIVWT